MISYFVSVILLSDLPTLLLFAINYFFEFIPTRKQLKYFFYLTSDSLSISQILYSRVSANISCQFQEKNLSNKRSRRHHQQHKHHPPSVNSFATAAAAAVGHLSHFSHQRECHCHLHFTNLLTLFCACSCSRSCSSSHLIECCYLPYVMLSMLLLHFSSCRCCCCFLNYFTPFKPISFCNNSHLCVVTCFLYYVVIVVFVRI